MRMQLGLELARLTAGLDRLYRDVPRTQSFLDREGLIPVTMAQVEPYALQSYSEARDQLEALQAGIPGEAESALRRAYLLHGAPETRQSFVSSAVWCGGENEIRNGIQTIDDGERGATQGTEREACLCVVESDTGSVGVHLVPTELLTFSTPNTAQSDEANTCDADLAVERLVVAIAFAREDRKAFG